MEITVLTHIKHIQLRSWFVDNHELKALLREYTASLKAKGGILEANQAKAISIPNKNKVLRARIDATGSKTHYNRLTPINLLC